MEVVAGVIIRHGRVLVCQRRADADHPGKWEFPGGKVESGESLPEALRRELREELAIEACVGRLLWRIPCHYPGRRPILLSFFAVEQYAGELDNRQFATVRWVPPGSLRELDWLEGDRAFVTWLAANCAILGAI